MVEELQTRSISESQISNTKDFINKNDMNILLVNARSLSPKLYSLIDTMQESNAQISMVTETWMRSSPQLEQRLVDMREALGYDCIRNDRPTLGGGVAIIYKTGDLQLHRLKTGCDYEIVAAVGRRTGQRRKIVVLVAYIPPNFDAENSQAVLDKIVQLIGTFKRRYNSPYFLIGGDFNCLLYTSPSPRDRQKSRMPSSA